MMTIVSTSYSSRLTTSYPIIIQLKHVISPKKKRSIATDKHSWFTTSTEVVTMLIQEVLGNPQYFT